MVTKALHPSDPMARCGRAEEAVDAELAALRKDKVWSSKVPPIPGLMFSGPIDSKLQSKATQAINLLAICNIVFFCCL